MNSRASYTVPMLSRNACSEFKVVLWFRLTSTATFTSVTPGSELSCYFGFSHCIWSSEPLIVRVLLSRVSLSSVVATVI